MMSFSAVFGAVRNFLMLIVAVLIWGLAVMIMADRFIYPFTYLRPWLMPWKMMDALPFDATLSQRLMIMQGILDASGVVANIALLVMIASFSLFSIYLTFLYQQRQRRTQENRLLLLKNREIARRNEFIRYISATIGHEFKNNLGRIKRRLDLIGDLPAETKNRLDSNFAKLFADIDIFKRISDEREAGLLKFTGVDLRDMLRSISSQYADFADVRTNWGVDLSPSVIFASETLLKTVFENLFDNAIKYKKPEQNRARVSISCSLDEDGSRKYIAVSFRDEGTGMDEQQADMCFYKGKSESGGWGEGLYFVKYIVGLHAGKIRIGKEYTAPGTGTEIIINLPFVEEAFHV